MMRLLKEIWIWRYSIFSQTLTLIEKLRNYPESFMFFVLALNVRVPFLANVWFEALRSADGAECSWIFTTRWGDDERIRLQMADITQRFFKVESAWRGHIGDNADGGDSSIGTRWQRLRFQQRCDLWRLYIRNEMTKWMVGLRGKLGGMWRFSALFKKCWKS